MNEAFITPSVLRWARERTGLSSEALAKKLPGKDEQLLIMWEKGEARPTFRQAQKVANTLHVPFGYLFLSSPPEEKLPIPDLRTLPDVGFYKISPDFHDLINEALRKQNWYREYIMDEGGSPLSFVGEFALNAPPEAVADNISAILGISEEFRRAAPNWEQFLLRFILQTEQAGILVLRSGVVGNNSRRKLSVSEFRGFAISDKYAPLIFLNSRDAKAAQIFTLAHELAHIWIGESGISNPDLGQPKRKQRLQIEEFCNRVAAELLVPRKQLILEWNKRQTLDENVQKLTARFRVSSLVILRRAFDLDQIGWDTFFAYYQEEVKAAFDRTRLLNRQGGGDFYATLLTRHSALLTQAVVAAAFQGRLLYREAASLLALKKIKTLDGIAKELGLR
jgi:Zn-dependent peptidase ImmA (M78 family)/DNA-binding XRE family transcriptional regulator